MLRIVAQHLLDGIELLRGGGLLLLLLGRKLFLFLGSEFGLAFHL
jgi:hypothetical protein